MEENKIVLQSGLIGSGKTTRANKLVKDHGYTKLSFADKLREQTFYFIGYKPDNYDNFKKKLLFLDKLPIIISKILKLIFPNWLYGRELLQKIGHGQRLFNGNFYWTEQIINKIKQLKEQGKTKIVIDDVRYKNELIELCRLAKEYDMSIVFNNHKSDRYVDTDNHLTEQLALWLRDNLKLTDGTTFKANPDIPFTVFEKIMKNYKGE